MGPSSSWRDALMRLHVAGWDTDDIDAACAALADACDEEAGVGVEELSSEQVRAVLEVEVREAEVSAVRAAAIGAGGRKPGHWPFEFAVGANGRL